MANRDLTPWAGATGLAPFGGRDPFSSFRREMDRLFDDFLIPAEPRSFGAAATAALRPSVDVHETDTAYTVTVEVPGVDRKDIELNLRDNVLTLSGEKRSERHETGEGRSYSERSYGRFERSIPFETEVDADKVQATCADGVLTVTLPKNAKAHDGARKIEIRTQPAEAGPGAG
jgi:HSP20 family protein